MTLQNPGTKNGPCERKCGHIKCQSIRKIAKTKCKLCGKPIGYNTRYVEYEGRLFHADCLRNNRITY